MIFKSTGWKTQSILLYGTISVYYKRDGRSRNDHSAIPPPRVNLISHAALSYVLPVLRELHTYLYIYHNNNNRSYITLYTILYL